MATLRHDDRGTDITLKRSAARRTALRLVRENQTGYDAEDVAYFNEANLYAFLEMVCGYEWDGVGWKYWGTMP